MFIRLCKKWLTEVESRTRGQGQGHKKISRPRTDPLEAEAKDQGHRRKSSPKKRSSKKFFSGDSTWGNQKKGLCRFSANFLAFSNEISTVQKLCCPRAEDRGIFEDLRLRGQGQGLQNLFVRTSSRPRTFSWTPPLVVRCGVWWLISNQWYFFLKIFCQQIFHKYEER